MDAGSDFLVQIEHVVIISLVNLGLSLLAVVRLRLEAFKKAQSDVVSPAGAVGLMQIMQKFHPDVDLTDPATNIELGCDILSSDYRYLNHFRLGLSPTEPVDWSLYANVGRALRGFYMGSGTVVWYDRHPDKAYPVDADQYVANILGLFRKGLCK